MKPFEFKFETVDIEKAVATVYIQSSDGDRNSYTRLYLGLEQVSQLIIELKRTRSALIALKVSAGLNLENQDVLEMADVDKKIRNILVESQETK